MDPKLETLVICHGRVEIRDETSDEVSSFSRHSCLHSHESFDSLAREGPYEYWDPQRLVERIPRAERCLKLLLIVQEERLRVSARCYRSRVFESVLNLVSKSDG